MATSAMTTAYRYIVFSNDCFRHEELEEQRVDTEMFDVECIRKTRSGIAFTQYVRRPYHLPRLLSEGQIERRAQPRVSQYASFVPITTTKPNRSGKFPSSIYDYSIVHIPVRLRMSLCDLSWNGFVHNFIILQFL
jgi:hypothetical protein